MTEILASDLIKDILVCYHKSCTDGFGAACVIYRKFGEDADYFPVQYQTEYDIELFRNKEVYIVDFSFPRDYCLLIQSVAKSVLILDHHKSAQTALDGLDFAIFDMSKSGALLTWDYFNPNINAPIAIQYISNYDLWNHYIPDIAWFNKSLSLIEHDFIKWNELIDNCQNSAYLDQFLEKGKSIDAFIKQQVKFQAKHGFKCIIDDQEGLIVNCSSIFISELGNTLASESGTFGACYSVTGSGDVLLSFRSNGDYDVSKLALKFGGGGHKNAAGCKIHLRNMIHTNDYIKLVHLN